MAGLYPQLVESYRRKSDGMPMHRVIASLGHLTQMELDNLKAALDASRQGKKVVVANALSRRKARPTKPAANLKYLDVAVLLEMWRHWGGNAMELPGGQPQQVLARLPQQRPRVPRIQVELLTLAHLGPWPTCSNASAPQRRRHGGGEWRLASVDWAPCFRDQRDALG